MFVERTTSPVIELPARWRHQGQLLSLAPGAYRWYVWTIGRDGRRGDAAVVQARLVVPSR